VSCGLLRAGPGAGNWRAGYKVAVIVESDRYDASHSQTSSAWERKQYTIGS
jgi:hypothetical protein